MATGRFVNNMSVAIFGGTFNPVHNGHLRIAIELAELLEVDNLRMIPCALPAHREAPSVSPEQRLEMLKLGIGDQALLQADDIELRREGPSYTIDTLREIRTQIGDSTPLYLCVGMDVLASLDSWRDWQQLTDFCHLIVSSRPGYQVPKSGPLAEWVKARLCDDLPTLKQSSAGKLHLCNLTMLAISSTAIRNKISASEKIDYLTPAAVVNCIQQQHLYE
jgi:nicotinate-nucleotide adenylyltransferase